MQQNPKRSRISRIAVWAAIAIVYCAVSAAAIVWYASPSRQDLATERQLIGQWGMWLSKSAMNTPPERVMEWLPDGKADNYAPGSKDNQPQPDVWQRWYIRDGVLVWQVRSAKTRRIVETRHKLEWIDSDNVRLTFAGLNGKPAVIYYRRLNVKTDGIQNTDEQSVAIE